MLIREVRARHEGGGELSLVLHAQLTVLTGLSAEAQVALADVLAAAVYGRTEGLSGWIDLHGAAIDLADWPSRVGNLLDHVDVFLPRVTSRRAARALVWPPLPRRARPHGPGRRWRRHGPR